METKVICQEILIMHQSHFFSRELIERVKSRDDNLSSVEQLAEACWHGLIHVALPEISSSLSLAEINEGRKFLDLRFSEPGQNIDNEFSVNPYLFLGGVRSN